MPFDHIFSITDSQDSFNLYCHSTLQLLHMSNLKKDFESTP